MTTDSSASSGRPAASDRFPQALGVVYAVLWAIAAVAPVDRQTWLLENGLVVCAAVVLLATHGRFAFSRLSYALIFVFMVLHAIGAHYTYSAVPAGDWAADTFGLARNHYDRLVHFAFGCLLVYPMREIALRGMHVHRAASYVVPVLCIVAFSACYEMIEAWAARIVAPSVGMAFVGAQGDVWDGQKDMSLALGGAIATMVVVAAWRRSGGREPYVALA
jgi:putative membrane protein